MTLCSNNNEVIPDVVASKGTECCLDVVDGEEKSTKFSETRNLLQKTVSPSSRRRSRAMSPVFLVTLCSSFCIILLIQIIYNSVGQSITSSSSLNVWNHNHNVNSYHRKNQEVVFNFEYLTSEDIYRRIHDWKHRFPDLVDVVSAQELYKLPIAGSEYDCPFEEGNTGGCSNWIVTIHDKNQSPDTTQRYMPEVFLSGALHGDEWIGPTTVIETAQLLLEAASCEALPQGHTVDGQQVSPERWEELLEEAKNCRQQLAERGIYPVHRKWLARLVTTRKIIIVPTANALGYYKGIREENNIDPNRDFPYDVEKKVKVTEGESNNNTSKEEEAPKCLESIAAQTIYSLFSDHAIQLGVTYHGGMEAIGYEWGAPSHLNDIAPDVTSQKQISKMFSSYAGSVLDNKEEERDSDSYYPIGSMNELVYPVNGGMEDWAYAGGWDTKLVASQCSATSDPIRQRMMALQQQQQPNDMSLRMFMSLVETSTDKKPPVADLGSNQDMFSPYGIGNGHVSRNIRLSLAMIDIVEPYVSILAVNNEELWDDIIPLSPRTSGGNGSSAQTNNSDRKVADNNETETSSENGFVTDSDDMSCRKTKVVSVPHGTEFVTVSWTIAGSITVDETSIWYGNWKALQSEPDSPFNCMETQPTREQVNNFLKSSAEPIIQTVPLYGKTRWHDETEFPKPGKDEALHPLDTIYSAQVDIRSFDIGESIAVYSVARVDQDWSKSSDVGTASPQTHLANVRTNPDWNYVKADNNDNINSQQPTVIQGRLDWFSVPLTIEISSPKSTIHEKSVRHPMDEWTGDDNSNNKNGLVIGRISTNKVDVQTLYKAAFAAMLLALVIWTCSICREESNGNEICQIWKERRHALRPLDDTEYDDVTIYDLQRQQQSQKQDENSSSGDVPITEEHQIT